MKKQEPYSWERVFKTCRVCERTFSASYFRDDEFPEKTAAEKAEAEAVDLCGPECVRASKVIAAVTR